MYIIGLDIGGSKIAGVLVQNKNILKSIERKTPREREEILKIVFDLINEMIVEIDKNLIIGIGIAVAGVIDSEKGIILKSPNIPVFDGFEIKKEIENVLNIEVRVCNDVDCLLLAEAKFGAGQRYSNILAVALGTGVGGGIMIDGKIIQGKHGSAGEIGHMVINKKYKAQSAKLIKEELLTFEDLCSRKWFEAMSKKPKEIEDKARAGDEESLKLFEEYGINFGISLANLINILDPEIVILGGGISRTHDLFMPKAKEIMQQLIISPRAREIEVVLAKFATFSSAFGASLLFTES